MTLLNQRLDSIPLRSHPHYYNPSSITASLATTLATSPNQTSVPSTSRRSVAASANTPTESTTTHSFPQSNTPDAHPVRVTPTSTDYIFDSLPAPSPTSGILPHPFPESLQPHLMPQPLPPTPTPPSSAPLSLPIPQIPFQSRSHREDPIFHPTSYAQSPESSRPFLNPPISSSTHAQSNHHSQAPWHVAPLATTHNSASPHATEDASYPTKYHGNTLPSTQNYLHSPNLPSNSSPTFRHMSTSMNHLPPSGIVGEPYRVPQRDGLSGTTGLNKATQGNNSGMGMAVNVDMDQPNGGADLTSPNLQFGSRMDLQNFSYADDDESERRIDTRRGKERVMRKCSCGHFNHIRKNNCERCDMPKPPPRKREKRPRRKKRQYLSSVCKPGYSQFGGSFGIHGFVRGARLEAQDHLGHENTRTYFNQMSSRPSGYTEQPHNTAYGAANIQSEPEQRYGFQRNEQEFVGDYAASGRAVNNALTNHSLGAPEVAQRNSFSRDDINGYKAPGATPSVSDVNPSALGASTLRGENPSQHCVPEQSLLPSQWNQDGSSDHYGLAYGRTINAGGFLNDPNVMHRGGFGKANVEGEGTTYVDEVDGSIGQGRLTHLRGFDGTGCLPGMVGISKVDANSSRLDGCRDLIGSSVVSRGR